MTFLSVALIPGQWNRATRLVSVERSQNKPFRTRFPSQIGCKPKPNRLQAEPKWVQSRPTGPGSSHGDAELRQVSIPRSPKGRPAAPKGGHGAPKVSPERSKESETDAQTRENEGPETRKVLPTTIEAQQLRKVKKRAPSKRELDF